MCGGTVRKKCVTCATLENEVRAVLELMYAIGVVWGCSVTCAFKQENIVCVYVCMCVCVRMCVCAVLYDRCRVKL